MIKKNEADVRAVYPIADLLPGWFFRVRETSNGAYLAEGTDLWGHTVSCRVPDGDVRACVAMASKIQRDLDKK